jgi:5,10-methenyltetrahydrofolate synthetase
MSESRLPPDDVIRVRVKGELRKRLRGLRMTMPGDACAKRSGRIVERLASDVNVLAAKSIALFWPIVEKHEIDLRPLDESLRARGVAIAYPAIDPETRLMTFRFAAPGDLDERGFGFREPALTAREATRGDLDVIIVPAIASATAQASTTAPSRASRRRRSASASRTTSSWSPKSRSRSTTSLCRSSSRTIA